MSGESTAQTFNGESYYKCGFYFQKKGRRLHRAVWEDHNGPIPKGYHVHHKDGDTSNNDIANLELLHGGEHLSLHMRARPPVPFTDADRLAAAEWHRSEEGKEWHRRHFQEIKEVLFERVEKSCAQCGSAFTGDRKSKFCSNNCKAKARRLSGVDDVEFICPVCGKTYLANKYYGQKTCSRTCGAISSGGKRKGVPRGGRVLPRSS